MEVILGSDLNDVQLLVNYLKVAFFSESAIRFSNLPIFKKKYSKKLSSAWNLNFVFYFQVQDSFLEYFYFWNLEI